MKNKIVSNLLITMLLLTTFTTTAFAGQVTQNNPTDSYYEVQDINLEVQPDDRLKVTFDFSVYANGVGVILKSFYDGDGNSSDAESLIVADQYNVVDQKLEYVFSPLNYNTDLFRISLSSPVNYEYTFSLSEIYGTGETGEPATDESSSQLVATFESVLLSAGVSSSATLHYSTNEKDPARRITADPIVLSNTSTAPVYAELVDVSVDSLSPWQPAIVEKSKFSNWGILGKLDTLNNIYVEAQAVEDPENLLNVYEHNPISAKSLLSPAKLFSIKPDGTGQVLINLIAGPSFDSQKELRLNFTWGFGLEE